ncbi:MAG: hypothetical protein NTX72_03050 [Candidatus Uhrbacteria bacterium]|nr:hypothetical protein [Candidatus Uhrbacteria bacterium]
MEKKPGVATNPPVRRSLPNLKEFVADAKSTPILANAIAELRALDEEEGTTPVQRYNTDWAILANEIVGQETV